MVSHATPHPLLCFSLNDLVTEINDMERLMKNGTYAIRAQVQIPLHGLSIGLVKSPVWAFDNCVLDTG